MPKTPCYFPELSPKILLPLVAGPATNWRWPFVIVALPSLVVTGVMLAVVHEPPRGITEPALQVLHLHWLLDANMMTSQNCGGHRFSSNM